MAKTYSVVCEKWWPGLWQRRHASIWRPLYTTCLSISSLEIDWFPSISSLEIDWFPSPSALVSPSPWADFTKVLNSSLTPIFIAKPDIDRKLAMNLLKTISLKLCDEFVHRKVLISDGYFAGFTGLFADVTVSFLGYVINGVARAFTGGRVAHKKDQIEEDNEEKIEEIWEKRRRMTKNWGNVHFLPTRGWQSGYMHLWL